MDTRSGQSDENHKSQEKLSRGDIKISAKLLREQTFFQQQLSMRNCRHQGRTKPRTVPDATMTPFQNLAETSGFQVIREDDDGGDDEEDDGENVYERPFARDDRGSNTTVSSRWSSNQSSPHRYQRDNSIVLSSNCVYSDQGESFSCPFPKQPKGEPGQPFAGNRQQRKKIFQEFQVESDVAKSDERYKPTHTFRFSNRKGNETGNRITDSSDLLTHSDISPGRCYADKIHDLYESGFSSKMECGKLRTCVILRQPSSESVVIQRVEGDGSFKGFCRNKIGSTKSSQDKSPHILDPSYTTGTSEPCAKTETFRWDNVTSPEPLPPQRPCEDLWTTKTRNYHTHQSPSKPKNHSINRICKNKSKSKVSASYPGASPSENQSRSSPEENSGGRSLKNDTPSITGSSAGMIARLKHLQVTSMWAPVPEGAHHQGERSSLESCQCKEETRKDSETVRNRTMAFVDKTQNQGVGSERRIKKSTVSFSSSGKPPHEFPVANRDTTNHNTKVLAEPTGERLSRNISNILWNMDAEDEEEEDKARVSSCQGKLRRPIREMLRDERQSMTAGPMHDITGKSVGHHLDYRCNTNTNYEETDCKSNSCNSFIGQYLYELWKNRFLCDVKLKVGVATFPAHKIVLAAFSDRFCPLDPQNLPSVTFDIPNSSSEAVCQILQYLYTSEMELHDDILEDVHNAACFLGIEEIVKLVEEILSSPAKETLPKYMEIRKSLGMNASLVHFPDLVRENFLEVMTTTAFLQLPLEEFKTILEDPDVQVEGELDVVCAILHWIAFDPANRKCHGCTLFRLVNYDALDLADLSRVIEDNRHLLDLGATGVLMDVYKNGACKGQGQSYPSSSERVGSTERGEDEELDWGCPPEENVDADEEFNDDEADENVNEYGMNHSRHRPMRQHHFREKANSLTKKDSGDKITIKNKPTTQTAHQKKHSWPFGDPSDISLYGQPNSSVLYKIVRNPAQPLSHDEPSYNYLSAQRPSPAWTQEHFQSPYIPKHNSSFEASQTAPVLRREATVKRRKVRRRRDLVGGESNIGQGGRSAGTVYYQGDAGRRSGSCSSVGSVRGSCGRPKSSTSKSSNSSETKGSGKRVTFG